MKRLLPLFVLALLPACSNAESPDSETPIAKKENTMFRTIDADMFASPQISIADIAAAKEAGVTMIINNRPDGEDPDAPQGAEIEAAAKAAGLDYVAIPVTHSGFSRPQIDAMNEALAKVKTSGGKALGYCRSGTRSTLLWALARAAKGDSPRVIAAKAADAGYDVAPIELLLQTLSTASEVR
jgi:uncharacterized protein (TIGR01244 family)